MAGPRKGARGRAARREVLDDVGAAQGLAPDAPAFERTERALLAEFVRIRALGRAYDRARAAKVPDDVACMAWHERLVVAAKAAAALTAIHAGLAKAAKVRAEIRVDQSPDRIELVGVDALDAQMERPDLGRGPVH